VIQAIWLVHYLGLWHHVPALGSEYKEKQNHYRELGVLPSFRVRTFIKYKNISEMMISKVRKDFMVFKRCDFIVKWFTVVDFHTLKAMFLLTTTEEKKATLSLFCELGISLQDQFCQEIEVNLWRKRGKQIFSKTVRASKLTWQGTLHCRYSCIL